MRDCASVIGAFDVVHAAHSRRRRRLGARLFIRLRQIRLPHTRHRFEPVSKIGRRLRSGPLETPSRQRAQSRRSHRSHSARAALRSGPSRAGGQAAEAKGCRQAPSRRHERRSERGNRSAARSKAGTPPAAAPAIGPPPDGPPTIPISGTSRHGQAPRPVRPIITGTPPQPHPRNGHKRAGRTFPPRAASPGISPQARIGAAPRPRRAPAPLRPRDRASGPPDRSADP